MCPRCAALEERIEDLEYELGVARDRDKAVALSVALGITLQQGEVLLALYAAKSRAIHPLVLLGHIGRPRSGDQSKTIEVQVCRIRKALGPDVIETVHGIGYRISDFGTRMVDDALGRKSPRLSPGAT